MSLFSPKTATNSKLNRKLLGYRVQTSLYGVAIPIPYGTNRLTGNVIWTGDWKADPVKEGGKGGGKGSSRSGKGGSGSEQYTYSTALMIALCQGPIKGVRNVWIDKDKLTVPETTETFVVPGNGQYSPNQRTRLYKQWWATKRETYNQLVDDFGSPAPYTLSGSQDDPLEYTDSANPGPGQYTYDSVAGVFIFNAADIGKTATISYSITNQISGRTGDPLIDLNLSFFAGTQGQSPWTYLNTHHGDQALGYTQIAYVASERMDLGQSGLVPNLGFEIMGQALYPGQLDSCPADVIYDILNNERHGVLFPTTSIGPLTELSNYCVANGLFISPIIDAQQSAAQWIESLLKIANAEAVWSGGTLKFRARGDTTVIGNGATFTPDTQPIYDLDVDDFLADAGDPPITITRPSVQDVTNCIRIEWNNRDNAYNTEVAEEKDDLSIRQYGLRPAEQVTYPGICKHGVAQKVARTELQRSVYHRNQYKFRLPLRYFLLEPMDLVTLTDPYLGMNKTPVRIIEISENDDLTHSLIPRCITCIHFRGER